MKPKKTKNIKLKNIILNTINIWIILFYSIVPTVLPSQTDSKLQNHFYEIDKTHLFSANTTKIKQHNYFFDVSKNKKQKTNLVSRRHFSSRLIHYKNLENTQIDVSSLEKIISSYKEFKINLNKHWTIKEEGIVFQRGKRMKILIN